MANKTKTGAELAQTASNAETNNVNMSVNDTALAIQTVAPPNLEGWEQRGLPPIIKPAQMPVNAWLVGKIVKAAPSSLASIKNPLIYIETEQNGMRFTVAFPCVATVASAFDIRPGETPTAEQLQNYVGWGIALQKIGQAPVKKGQKKGAHLFKVFLKPPAKR